MGRILILGGGGMIGQKLAARLLAANATADVTLFDIGFPPNAVSGTAMETGNLATAGVVAGLAKQKFDTIFHLASIVSGEAESNFTKGYTVNLHPMIAFLEALRLEHEAESTYRPRFVFTSSIAVFGGPYPEWISDDFAPSPQTSYGTQKLMCEALVQDYSRKGFIDGLSLRLPTICVRPGKPNLAASSFFSGIIREPLNGQEAILPVPDTTRHWFATPKAAAGFLVHAAELDTGMLGGHRALNLPGVSCTVAQQIDALRTVAGQTPVELISAQPDETIMSIVAGWPTGFTADRATALGFSAETSFEEIIKTYIAEELS
ncbi:MAG: D-erythronate dehydrogenase [Pseudomonadota bacterium]